MKKMQTVALSLLIGAALLYVLALSQRSLHPAWGYVAAFAEAAMVGALADWFAVVALFRHPLGLPIPHTAIVPKHKERLGAGLADFICEHFLSTPQVLGYLQARNWVQWTGERLRAVADQPAWQEKLTPLLAALLPALNSAGARDAFGRFAKQALHQLDPAPLAANVLDTLTLDGRHQRLLDSMLAQLAEGLASERWQNAMTDAIAREVKALRYVGLDQVAARAATAKLISAVAHTLSDMAKDPQHALRVRFDEQTHQLIERLKSDPALQQRLRVQRDAWIAHPATQQPVIDLWQRAMQWLQDDLAAAQPQTVAAIQSTLVKLGDRLCEDTDLQNWINDHLQAAAPRWIDRYRETLRRTIVQRVNAWNATEVSQALERQVGRDLQFIRINGTLVGGLAGLVIYALSHRWLT